LGIPAFKLLLLLLTVLTLAFLWAINRPAIAAPPDTPGAAIGKVAQERGVTLDKRASAEVVPLGQVVTFTVIIKNNGAETINPTLTDTLPDPAEGLALLEHDDKDKVANTGAVEFEDNALTWTGSLASGEEAVIVYQAIPPTTSTPGQTLENKAVLQFGETILQDTVSIQTADPGLGIWGSFVNFIAKALIFFDQSLEALNLPYAFGFAIILFTVLVRGATFPLNMQQIKSSKAMQDLQPKLKEIQEKYKGDREKLAQEQMRLYKEHGVNPLGGCLPLLVQMPIWFALYQALIQLSHEGLLIQGFFWIPSLAGPPLSQDGGGFLPPWLYPFVDGAPPIGWADALAYMVLPVLLVISQIYMQNLMTPTSSDPQQAQMQSIMKFMPIMFGYFSLIVPSGLTLYWFTSNILALIQQYFTKSQVTQPQTTTEASSSISAPVHAPTTVPASTSGETSQEDKKGKNVRSKRKSRRKR
jgi:YidC/Oxa1 family membrane protein insertase